MIELTSNHAPMPAALLDAQGGFAWWYVDIVDPDGNGAVVIWSFGLPFLPGYTSAARRGQAPPARALPSLNVVLYRAGKPWFYLLQTYDPRLCEAGPGDTHWRFADTRITHQRDGNASALLIELDCPIPRSNDRLVGTVALRAARRVPSASEVTASADLHHWSPQLAGGIGEADVRAGTEHFSCRGSAYHDRNGSPHHIDGLGIRDWFWGRVRTHDRTHILYWLRANDPATSDRVIGVEIDDDGATRTFAPRVVATSRGRDRYGVGYPCTLVATRDGAPWMEIARERTVDRGPFYLRQLATFTLIGGASHRGWTEVVVPGRVDLARHRALVRMRVHSLTARNSWWLPLFSGPQRGRWSRLVGASRGARAALPSAEAAR